MDKLLKQIQSSKIELRSTDQLIPYARNARKHEPWQVAQIAASIKEFGFTNPVLIDASGEIVAGHGRVMAALKLELPEVPCIVLGHLTPTQRRAYVLADNQLALNSSWDTGILSTELEELKIDGFDLDLLGFGDDLDSLLTGSIETTDGLTDPDDVPEVEKPIVTKGEVWVLGNHRLMCGDSSLKENVCKLFNGEQPILMVTDPPYGVNYDAEWREKALGDKFMGKARTGKVANDHRSDWTDVYSLSGCQIAYVWHASAFADVVMNGLREAGYEIKQQIIWNKTVAAMSRQSYHWKHEPCWYAVKKGKDLHWNGDRKQNTVWDGASPLHIMSGSKEEKTPHPTQKPTMIYEHPIKNHLLSKESLYDPFSGSGSAIIACEKTGRRCFGMELDPHYCTVILKRWAQFTGKEPARLEDDGSLTPMTRLLSIQK